VKKHFLLGSVLVVMLMIVGTVSLLKQKTAADTTLYTCQADGTFAQQSSGPAALTSSDLTKVASANAWLTSMMQPDVNIVTSSTITPAQDYTPSYTGATSGTYNLQGRTYAVTNPESIVVDTPATVPDSYRGVITAHVTLAPTPGRWIIQAYKNNNGTITQVPVQALADGTTGDFSIDLSGVDPSLTGQWMLGVLDADNSYAEYGTKWPNPGVYTNLEVQELVVTDTTYLWASQEASADGTFAFDNDQVGAKMFRLYDTSTDEVLAQSFDPTGLIRSYEYQPGEAGYGTGIQDLTYLYDQALALFAAVGQDQPSQASTLVQGLLKMQTTTGAHAGGFVFAAPQLSPTYTDPYYRTGADAIALDALLAYIKQYPNDANIATYKAAALQGLSFIQSEYSSSGATAGLYLGGFGEYSGNPQTFDPTYVVTFASTEHNIDIWHVLVDAAQVFGTSPTDYTTMASDLDTAIQSNLYDTVNQRFYQGINGGVPDVGDPLDTNSWGSIQMYAAGNVTQAQQALTHLSVFQRTVDGISGYTPFYDTVDYPGAVANVWYEGSFGAALAEFDAGNYSTYRAILDELTPAQQADGSFRYAEAVDSTYGMSVSESVASTAWYVLATVGRGAIWSGCNYDPLVDVTDPTTPAATTPDSSDDSSSDTTSDDTATATPIAPSDLATSTTPEDPADVKAVASDPVTPASSTKKSVPVATKQASKVSVPALIVGASAGTAVVGGGSWWGIARIRRGRGL
jgi:hypothetical protein